MRVSFGEGGARASASAGGRGGTRGKARGRRAKPVVVRVRHVYGGDGRYRVTVRARDKAGNMSKVKREVRIG